VCGIVGIAAYKTSVPVAPLEQALEAIAHRGPDDSGLQVIKITSPVPLEIGFGNRRLSILDLSAAGHQPMNDPATGNWITYNGEVYNFRDVRAKLEGEGIRFSSQSDTEVVLKAFGRWGEKCLDEFRGMFAFAIWDEARQRLFIARDRLGIKPLYYSFNDAQLLFSSEVRSLLQTGLIPRRLSSTGLLNYLTFGSVCDPATLIEGVYALRAGHYLTWEKGRIAETEYWEVGTPQAENGATRAAALNGKGDEKILAKLREVLTEAVSLRLVSDVPVGVFLSGGIDSSVLVGLLSRDAATRVSTFSIVFKEADYSEAQFSQTIARCFNTDHHEIVISQHDAFESIPDAISAMDQPTMDGINTYVVSREAHRAGLKVALSGLGGDELFAGYETFKTVAKMERFASAWAGVPTGIKNSAAMAFSSVMPSSDRNTKLTSLIQGDGAAAHPYVLSRMLFTRDQQNHLLKDPDAARFDKANQTIAPKLARAERFDPINRVSYLELRNYMLNTLLRDSDVMSMAHGLEVRVPLIDHKLVEYVFNLPGELKINGHTPKHLLIKAAGDLLPDEVVHRPKRGFTFPFEHWLRDGMRNEIESELLSESPLDEFLSPEAVKKVWQEFLAGRISWSRPWSLYVLRRWCRLHL
jgi:asparagine synthase (glutamine-hydrolysing)